MDEGAVRYVLGEMGVIRSFVESVKSERGGRRCSSSSSIACIRLPERGNFLEGALWLEEDPV